MCQDCEDTYDDGLDDDDFDGTTWDERGDYDDDERDDRVGADYFDEADYEERRREEEYWEHCGEHHDGQHCDCREPLRYRIKGRLTGAWCTLRARWRKYDQPYSDEPPF